MYRPDIPVAHTEGGEQVLAHEADDGEGQPGVVASPVLVAVAQRSEPESKL